MVAHAVYGSKRDRWADCIVAAFSEDPWIVQQIFSSEVKELENCSIAVDASYFIQLNMDMGPAREPLACALGGPSGFLHSFGKELDRWAEHHVTPLFVFDGQPMAGQDSVSIAAGLREIARTDTAWNLYFKNRAGEAVSAFGAGCMYNVKSLYPLLQRLLKERHLHFLTAPYNAAAQLAYLDMVDSDQCAGIMGGQELLLYPVSDSIIRNIHWEANKVEAFSKKQLIKTLNVSEAMFQDGLLMTGTSFLTSFPPLRDSDTYPRQSNVMDAINMLRTTDKNIANLCASFHDVLQSQDPNWLDKFRKARMAVDHFIYIAESGEVLVHDYDRLTRDNHEYLGLQLPAELLHYLNTGLVGPEVLSWITHCQITVLPTLDGYASEEYRRLISTQLVRYYEAALGLVIPRLNRGLHYRDVQLKVWYDSNFSLKINHRNEANPPSARLAKWNMTPEVLAAVRLPGLAEGKSKSKDGKDGKDGAGGPGQPGSILFEVLALADQDFVGHVLETPKVRGMDSADVIVSLALWQLLTLDGYVEPGTLQLTRWGRALSTTLAALQGLVKRRPEFPGVFRAALHAFELIKLGLLTSGPKHPELQGWPVQGSDEDRNCVVLISRVATLVQLRQNTSGYTGPLSKNLLCFHSLATAVGKANRSVLEALLASMFLSGQAKRDGPDHWEMSHRLPFYDFPDVALGIAVKTYLDDTLFEAPPEDRARRLEEFPKTYVPHATQLYEDFEVVFGLVDALQAGVATLGDGELKATARAEWQAAKTFLEEKQKLAQPKPQKR